MLLQSIYLFRQRYFLDHLEGWSLLLVLHLITSEEIFGISIIFIRRKILCFSKAIDLLFTSVLTFEFLRYFCGWVLKSTVYASTVMHLSFLHSFPKEIDSVHRNKNLTSRKKLRKLTKTKIRMSLLVFKGLSDAEIDTRSGKNHREKTLYSLLSMLCNKMYLSIWLFEECTVIDQYILLLSLQNYKI